MNPIIFKSLNDAIHVEKDTGTKVDYYISDEYEIHYNQISPHTIQEWHYHTQLKELIFITKGTLLCQYLENNHECSRHLHENDLVDVGNSIHTFQNDTDKVTEFIVFRFIPEGKNKREMIKKDKTIVER